MFEQHVQQHLSERRRQRGPGTPARPRSAPAAMRAAPIRSDPRPRPPGPLPPASHARRCDPGPMRADSAPQAPRSPSCRQRRPELRTPHRKPALSETRPARTQPIGGGTAPPANQSTQASSRRAPAANERATDADPPTFTLSANQRRALQLPPASSRSQPMGTAAALSPRSTRFAARTCPPAPPPSRRAARGRSPGTSRPPAALPPGTPTAVRPKEGMEPRGCTRLYWAGGERGGFSAGGDTRCSGGVLHHEVPLELEQQLRGEQHALLPAVSRRARDGHAAETRQALLLLALRLRERAAAVRPGGSELQ